MYVDAEDYVEHVDEAMQPIQSMEELKVEDHVEHVEEAMQPFQSHIQSVEELKAENLFKKKKVKRLLEKCRLYEQKLKRRNPGKLENIFNKDQLEYLESSNCRGSSWSDKTIEKGLKLYLACGSTGYDELRRQKLPYPSRRTLQHRLAKLKFKPGILDEVFAVLKLKVSLVFSFFY